MKRIITIEKLRKIITMADAVFVQPNGMHYLIEVSKKKVFELLSNDEKNHTDFYVESRGDGSLVIGPPSDTPSKVKVVL